jgi:hypothetical protein
MIFCPPTPALIAKRVEYRMQVMGLTVAKAAHACNLSQASFETYRYGQNLPGALALAALAWGLDCSADWLLFGGRPQQPSPVPPQNAGGIEAFLGVFK